MPAERADRLGHLDAETSSIALTALIWYATGQMPQMRAVMSGASERAPAQKRLEEARRLEDAQLDVLDRAVASRTDIAPSPSTRAR